MSLLNLDFYQASKNEDTYILSPLYYQITGRKSAWYYKTLNAYVVVAQHPHKNDTLLVFPELGDGEYDLSAAVLQNLYKFEQKIQLARYTDDNLISLKDALNRVSGSLVSNIESMEEDSLDWRYPVHILNTEKVSLMEGPEFYGIRSKYKRVEKKIDYKTLNRSDAVKEMRAALKFWEGNMIIADKETEDMTEFYNEFFKIIDGYTGNWDGVMFYDGKRPVGFSIWEVVSDTHANSFINLSDVSTVNLSNFQRVTICKILHEKGIKYLNVGGSETESLDQFKRKFCPEKSIEVKSAMVEYKKFNTDQKIEYAKFI